MIYRVKWLPSSLSSIASGNVCLGRLEACGLWLGAHDSQEHEVLLFELAFMALDMLLSREFFRRDDVFESGSNQRRPSTNFSILCCVLSVKWLGED